MTHRLLTFLIAAVIAVGPLYGTAAAQTRAQSPLPTLKLSAGIHVITAELATTHTARQTGLMFRERLAPNHGMLFVFEGKWSQCFWMRNTPLPLTIAFIEDDGTIVQLADMTPFDENNHCSERPVRFALEMEKNWFAKRGLKVGSRLGGLPTPR
jgi:uncharacterized membrane protein (UPF0127 family)